MSAHTPGPWAVSRKGTSVMGNDGDVRIADCRDDDVCDEEAEKANARLISAAPNLLAALEMFVRPDAAGYSARDRMALDAIAKARGVK